MERILLASGSPRRRELLTAAGIPFDILVPGLDETKRDSLLPAERVLALAEDKARAASKLSRPASPRLVLAADTLVCINQESASGEEQALGKPEDEDEARRMLLRLAARTHIVRTGVVLLDRATDAVFSLRSDSTVRFAAMDISEIDAYLASGEWHGAAGAYRIQGLAAFFIDRLEGSWTGVVGLPMQELYVILKRAEYRFPFKKMGPA